jgi:hypothetical protein
MTHNRQENHPKAPKGTEANSNKQQQQQKNIEGSAGI